MFVQEGKTDQLISIYPEFRVAVLRVIAKYSCFFSIPFSRNDLDICAIPQDSVYEYFFDLITNRAWNQLLMTYGQINVSKFVADYVAHPEPFDD